MVFSSSINSNLKAKFIVDFLKFWNVLNADKSYLTNMIEFRYFNPLYIYIYNNNSNKDIFIIIIVLER